MALTVTVSLASGANTVQVSERQMPDIHPAEPRDPAQVWFDDGRVFEGPVGTPLEAFIEVAGSDPAAPTVAALIDNERVGKMICSYPRTANSTVFPEQYRAGKVELELVPQGTLAERMYAAMLAGDAEGGDARGKQSAAMLVVKEGAGYGGYTDQAIDIRVDDHPEPFKELGRLLDIAQVNYTWNEAWTLFTRDQYDEALPYMENTARLAPENAERLNDYQRIWLDDKRWKHRLVVLHMME